MSYLDDPDTVVISRKEYNKLLWRDQQLMLLEGRGVDNWEGYGMIPLMEDFNTVEEWLVACDEAFDNWDY